MNTDHATLDLETRSACNLKQHGAWRYAQDPTTEVLCMAFRLPWWPAGRTALWHPARPAIGLSNDADDWSAVEELIAWIGGDGLVECHNAGFERAMWVHKMVPRYGWPAIPGDNFRCSAAKAAAHALPRKLEDACKALQLSETKDTAGGKVMLKLSKPRKPRKKEREAWEKIHGDAPHPTLWWEDQALFQRLFDYCRQDILAEEALSHALDDLSPQETTYYCLDQRMNQRGFQLDTDAVQSALSLIDSEVSLLNSELQLLTNGAVTKATQRAKMMAWLATQGLHLDDTRGTTLDEWLLPDSVAAVSAPARRAIEILRTLGRSSTAKYETMRDWAGPDGRVRGGLLYHGATTGRWSGAGVQPQNFVKGTIKNFNTEEAWTILKSRDRNAIMAKYPSVMEALACALRGTITAGPGHQLFCADYASIEARVLLWLAGEQDALRLFREGGDLYCDMASGIYDRPITEKDERERQVGKFAILGLGYQMGWSKFQATCATFGITIEDEFAQQVVEAYRQKYWRVKQLWYDTEAAACEAVTHKGHLVRHDRTAWQRMGRFLYCTLPSGRRLAYPEPELRKRQTPWGAEKWALTYKGVNTYTRQWERQTSYGGLLVENVVQAVSRDLMAAALQRCEESGVYTPVLSVHDEIIAEAPIGQGSVAEFEGLLMTVPTWAAGCPISAVGWRGARYRK